MLHNCLYNKIKLLHDLSCASWFIKKHAMQDAQEEKHTDCMKDLEEIQADLERHIKNIEKKICKGCQNK